MFRNTLLLPMVVAVALVPWTGLCTGQNPQPAARSEFRMRLIVSRDGYETNIRFNARTGEAWLVSRNRMDPVKEKGEVRQGEYDVVVASGDTSWWAFRVERKTGKAWTLSRGQWNEIVEAAPPPEGDYEVLLKNQGDMLWTRRFDRLSGRLWFGKWTGKGYEWVEMGKADNGAGLSLPLPK